MGLDKGVRSDNSRRERTQQGLSAQNFLISLCSIFLLNTEQNSPATKMLNKRSYPSNFCGIFFNF